ncbi:MAG: sodium/proton-translocating pyrophosphatase, partial [Weeksellaceae bacterium]|nr:sodium/proton-translocating pyrophosphatase [Weeksellaceae bacterium]
MKEISLWIPVILSIVGLLMMGFKFMWVNKQDAGNERMQSISKNIQDGALAFLSAEYRLLLIFVAVASLALFGISRVVDTTSWLIVPAFIIGAIFSALAGNVGMRVATAA